MDQSLGALLAQKDDNGHEQAIYYLIGVESHYNPIEKECLALIFAVQKMIGSEKCIFIIIFTITFSYLFI